MASHSTRWVAVGGTATFDKLHSERTPIRLSYEVGRQNHMSQWVC